MTSRERVQTAIAHEQPDRAPVCATYVPEIESALRAKYGFTGGDLGVSLGNDMVKIASGMENCFYRSEAEEYVCPYGITWRNVYNNTGHFSEIVRHPLSGDPAKIDAYQMPKAADAADTLEAIRKAVEAYGDEKWIVGSCQCSVFEAAWYLRGLEELLMDMAMEEDYVDALFDKVMQFPLEMGLLFIDAGADMIWLGDDIATQRGMMISPHTWRKYLKPRYEKMFEAFRRRRNDIVLCYHSCGNLTDVVDELCDIGLDVLNPIQPLAMEPAGFKKRFGKRLTLYGGMDVQRILPFGTASEVRQEVGRLLECCGEGGGYILSPAHHIQSDTPLENIEAFYDAHKSSGSC